MLAREALRGRWKTAFLAVLLYYALLSVPNFMLALPFSFSSSMMMMSLYSLLVTGPLYLGLAIFALAVIRNEEPHAGQILYGFERLLKALGLMIVYCVLIFLWSMLFVIPGIIAAYRYSQAFFILADHPEYGIFECIGRSKAMMAGNKGKRFLLDLSFIGWAILASLPLTAVSVAFPSAAYMPADIPYDMEAIFSEMTPSMPEAVITFIASLGVVLLVAYLAAAQAAFYEMASGNLKPGYIASSAEIIDEQQVRMEE
jgi:uncharacterized membrane protein